MNDFKTKIRNKTLMEKLYLIGFVIGVVSLFFNWVDAGIVRGSGFQQQGYLFLILMLYPFITTLMDKKRQKIVNLILAIINLIGIIFYMSTKIVTLFGETLCFASTGAYVMVIAMIIILIGAIMNMKKIRQEL